MRRYHRPAPRRRSIQATAVSLCHPHHRWRKASFAGSHRQPAGTQPATHHLAERPTSTRNIPNTYKLAYIRAGPVPAPAQLSITTNHQTAQAAGGDPGHTWCRTARTAGCRHTCMPPHHRFQQTALHTPFCRGARPQTAPQRGGQDIRRLNSTTNAAGQTRGGRPHPPTTQQHSAPRRCLRTSLMPQKTKAHGAPVIATKEGNTARRVPPAGPLG
jgi:hypothetical protein